MVNDMENNKKNIFKYILIVTILICACVGVTYAYFTASIKNEALLKTTVVTPDESKVEYLTDSSINLTNAEPGSTPKTVTFSVKLTGSTNTATHTSYSINWNVTTNTFTKLSTPDLVYKIESSDNGTTWTTIKNNIDATTLSVGDNKIITNQSLDAAAGKTATKYWRVTLSYLSLSSVDQSANMNKSFAGSIMITDVD